MKWENRRRSSNVEDRRGRGASRPLVGGGIGMIVVFAAAMFFGISPQKIMGVLQMLEPTVSTSAGHQDASPQAIDDKMGQFVSVVLADTEDTWHELFQKMGKTYVEPKLVLFDGSVSSACGFAQSATGPFYCPGDHKVYIDLAFYKELKDKFHAPGDFAQAYVIAHEVGHHVQNLDGTLQKVEAYRKRAGKVKANQMLVRLELQADCYAGVWGHHADKTRNILEKGDIEEALNAASSIGDDRIQQQSQGYVVPDSFTHGTSKQRMRWFKTGIEFGDYEKCNTFAANIE